MIPKLLTKLEIDNHDWNAKENKDKLQRYREEMKPGVSECALIRASFRPLGKNKDDVPEKRVSVIANCKAGLKKDGCEGKTSKVILDIAEYVGNVIE